MATYYVRNGGSDAADGLSDGNAFATLDKVWNTVLSAGDSVLFKCGSLWRGTELTPRYSGTAGNQITYGNYSTGELPIICMGVLLSTWTLDSGNVWWATLASNPGWVFMDNTIGDYKTTKAGLVNEFDFFWDSGASRLYIYAATDPDTRYTAPGVERRGARAIQPLQNYITIDGICFEKSDYALMQANSPGSYWTFKNCLMRYSDRGIELGNGAAYSEWDICDNEVCYCNMIGVGPGWDGTNIRVYRNHIHHIDHDEIYVPGPSGNSWTAGFKTFAENVTYGMSGLDVYENYIHDCGRGVFDEGCGHGDGIWPDTIHPNPTNPAKFHHNLIVDCTGGGVFVEISSDCHVYGNIIWNCGTCETTNPGTWAPAGIQVNCRDPYLSENNLFYNNTVYGGRQGILACTYSITSARLNNNIFKNNIVIGQTEYRLVAIDGGDNVTYGTGNVYEYNCFGAEATNFIVWGWLNRKSTYDAWETAYGGSTHSIEADPQMTDPVNGDFTLQATSPCIDAATDLGTAFQSGLSPTSVWPTAVVLLDQETHAVV